MRFATLGSGSAGNATLIEHDGYAILIDCGLSARQVERRAAAMGFDARLIQAVLVTHEHDDHISGVATLAKRFEAEVYMSAGTHLAAGERLAGLATTRRFTPDQVLALGAFEITPVIVPHDAREPCQFVVAAGGRRLGVLTDVGQITNHLERAYAGLDGFILEFNHDPALLADSPYPAGLKRRIGGEYGHLSNGQAERLLGAIDLSRLECFVAAHLSEKTNSPAHVAACLERSLPAHVTRHIADQSSGSPWCELGAS